MRFWAYILTYIWVIPTIAGAQGLYVEDTRSLGSYSDTYDVADAPNIRSLSELPPDIRHLVTGILTDRIPPYFTEKLRFQEGLRMNLKKYLARRNARYREISQVTYRWVMPAYTLWFAYVDTAAGVHLYAVKLELDEYGQVLGLNLPHTHQERSRTLHDSVDSRKHHHEWYEPPKKPYQLIPLRFAVDSARAWAQAAHLKIEDCRVDLHYDRCRDELYWQVDFRQRMSHTEPYHLEDIRQIYEIKADDLRLHNSYEADLGWWQ